MYENQLNNEQKEEFCRIAKIDDSIIAEENDDEIGMVLSRLYEEEKEEKMRNRLLAFW